MANKPSVKRVVLGVGFMSWTLTYKKGACNGSGLYETLHLEDKFRRGLPVDIGDGGALWDKRIRLVAEILPKPRRKI